MTNFKSTKRALFSSVIALLVCFTMLLGTTFAWFTDSVSSGINKIQSGTLDAELIYVNSYNGTPETVNADTKIFMDINGDPILWEPGAFASGRFEVVNQGTLALKYQLKLIYDNATETPDGKTLADVLSVYAIARNKTAGEDGKMEDEVLNEQQIDAAIPAYDPMNMPLFKDGFIVEAYLLPGESFTYEIGLCWIPSENDNDYNVEGGLSIDFGVVLLATQMTYETDGDGDWYDGEASYPDAPVIPDAWDGSIDTSWYDPDATEYYLNSAEALAGLADLVDAGNTFAGKTIKLSSDLDLYVEDENGEPICFDPIGSYRNDMIFEGIFDGQNHTIANMSQNTWALDNGYHYGDLGLGLFGAVENATIKNLVMDNASISGESALCGTIAAVAGDNVTFENITVKNSKVADYQYYAGGIVGWAGGDEQFINCVIDASTTIGAQWGEFNNANGGVIGGVSTSAAILMKDCTVACRIDAYNDVTSAYEWYSYRRSGMLIGDSGQVDDPDGDNVGNAIAPNLTCENVTVIYGDWANYHYCQFSAERYPWVRVEAGTSNSAYSNPRYGHPTDANGNEVVDENHIHNDGEKHNELIVFDQLYGGESGDRYCTYGTATHDGVTVIYNNK